MTPGEALAFVRARGGVVPFTGPGSFVEAVAGGPVKGSWWGHPKGHEIFHLAGRVGRECLLLKLLRGKETFVHESVYPALARVVLDEEWRAPRVKKLSAEAKKLLRRVTEEGSVRGAPPKLRLELERALLVHSYEVHTEAGRHATVLAPWESWVTPEVAKAAAKLSLDEALAALQL